MGPRINMFSLRAMSTGGRRKQGILYNVSYTVHSRWKRDVYLRLLEKSPKVLMGLWWYRMSCVYRTTMEGEGQRSSIVEGTLF